MEDALYRVGHKDVKVKSNEELVKRAIEVANILEREIATPDEARRMLGIEPRR
jgi:3-keto-5-aminohexanoate cleavage enzyme